MLKSHPLFYRVVLFIFLPLVLLVFGGLEYLKTGLPKIDGSISKIDIRHDIQIRRDEYGVPHVITQDDLDAFYAMGYLHAQDRLWQMEVQRRLGSGRMSEMLGAASIATDKYMRTLGIYHAAKASWKSLNEKTQAALQAYADGVNGWLSEEQVLPPEFIILDHKMEPWKVYDSLVMAKVLALTLSGGYGKDLDRLSNIRNVGAEKANDLTAIDLDLNDSYSNIGDDLLELQLDGSFINLHQQMASLYGVNLDNIGSNNWVVSGKHTASGKPILANDPHLMSSAPSVWYLASLKGDTLDVSGGTLPGLPFVIVGHNQHVSWGVTNMATDSLDLFMERVNPHNLDEVEGPNGMMTVSSRTESIVVKPQFLRLSEDPVVITVRESRHGPLLSEALNNPEMELSLSWSGLSKTDTTTQSMLELNYAQNWQQFRAALSVYVAPTMNFVYADTSGNIGYSAAGLVPLRNKGRGELPVPGWNDDYQWQGWIDFEDLPSVFNPDSGYIVTANNKVVDDSYGHFLGSNWSPPMRADRITQMLKEYIGQSKKFDIEMTAVMQQDQLSHNAVKLLPSILAAVKPDPNNDKVAQAIKHLKQWDGVMSIDSIATTIYHSWLSQFQQLVLADDIGEDNDYLSKPRPIFFINMFAKGPSTQGFWCNDVNTDVDETCVAMANSAMTKTLVELEHKLGSDMDDWQWGEVHKTQYTHMPFSHVRGLKSIFHREIANGGGDNTVNVATSSFDSEYKFLQFAQPAYRHIIDMADVNKSVYINTPGQSGHVLSTHYDDLMHPHGQVEFIPMHPADESGLPTFKLLKQ